MKVLNDKYALLKLRKSIALGPIYGHEKEIIYNLDKNNIIKNGKTITYHDEWGKHIYTGSDYIYKPFSIYVYIMIELLCKKDVKNDSRTFDIYKQHPRDYVVGARNTYTDEEKQRIINDLRNEFHDKRPFMNEIVYFLEGHRSCVLGVQSREYDHKEAYILNGKYTKSVRKDGTIIIYVHDPRHKLICNKKTGMVFEEAPAGEKYTENDYFYEPVDDVREDAPGLLWLLHILFDIRLRFIHLFRIGYDNKKKILKELEKKGIDKKD
jgi:hypothetical protein